MGRYEFDLALPTDDAELRRILRATPMPGNISVTFQREPSYMDAAVVSGKFEQVVICRDNQSQQAVGFGCRSVRSRYVNGHPQPIGYLSLLRLLAEHRNIGLVARGYKYFRHLHGDHRCALYLTTIAKGNEKAISVLTKGRAHLPRYHAAGDYHTAVIRVSRAHRHRAMTPTLEVRPATPGDLEAVLQFLARVGPSRQFFPKYEATDFLQATGTFRDLRSSHLLMAFCEQKLVGLLGGWDQHRFRQTVVEQLDRSLRWIRPLYNPLAAVWGGPKLPRPGERFRHITGTLPLVEHDDPVVFTALLDSLLTKLADEGHDYLLMGMHESDPLLKLALQRATTSYVTGLYYVCWSNGESLRNRLDIRPPYLELGCL